MRPLIDENTKNAIALAEEFYQYKPDTGNGRFIQIFKESPRVTPSKIWVTIEGKYFESLVNRMMNLYYPWTCAGYRRWVKGGWWTSREKITPLEAVFFGSRDGFFEFQFEETEIPPQ